MHILCPHCRNPVEVVKLTPEEVVCTVCGSSIRLEGGSTRPFTSPRRLGRFELLDAVGVGAFGTVYRARDPELDRVVAVKIPRAGNLLGPDEVDRFLREARSAAQLRHPAIVTVHEAGQSDGIPYLVSEFVEGITLADWLTARRPTAKEAAEVMLQAAEALQYAHDRGVIHRDVKPSNIMLERVSGGVVSGGGGSSEGRHSQDHSPLTTHHSPRLMDFGLAKREAGEITMTVEGQVLGTPAYMSPEQARGESHQVDGRSDVYSLGVILYQLVTGELPFRGNTRMLLHQVLHDEPRPPRSLNDRVPRDLQTICLKALAKEPRKRYASAGALADDLRRFLHGESIWARPVGQVEKLWRWSRRNPASAALIGVAATALVAIAVLSALFAVQQSQFADDQSKAAEQLRGEQRQTHLALDDAREQRGRAERLSATLALDRGVSMCEQGDLRRGLLWLARGLELAPAGAPDLNHAARANLAEWGKQVARLRAHFPQPEVSWSNQSTSVAVSPDGKRVATGHEKRLQLWESETGKPEGEPLDHGDHFWQVRFSPDGARLLTGGYVGTSWRLWDAASRQPVGQPFERAKGSEYAVFSPDSLWVLTVTREGRSSVWDAQTGRFAADLTPPAPATIGAAVFSPDSKSVLAACSDQTARLWDVTGGKPRGDPWRSVAAVMAVAFHPDGKTALTGGADGNVRLWDVAGGQAVGSWWKHPAAVTKVGFSADGSTAMTSCGDGVVRLWEAGTGWQRGQTTPHLHALRHVLLSADGRALVTADFGSVAAQVRFWDGATGLSLGQPLAEPDGVWDLAFTPDSRSLVVGAKGARLWDLPAGRARLAPFSHAGPVTAIAMNPEGTVIVTAGDDGTGRSWDAGTGKGLAAPMLHQGGVVAAGLAAQGKTLITLATKDTSWRPSGGPGEARAWDSGGKPIAPGAPGLPAQLLISSGIPNVAGQGPVTTVAFSSDGKRLLLGSGQLARVWDTATGKPVGEAIHGSPALSPMALRPDGGAVVAAYGLRLRLCDAVTGATLGAEMAHEGNGPLLAIAFSNDGKVLATSAADYTVRLWDGATGRPLATLPHPEWVHALAFGADGKQLWTGCGVDVWSRGRHHGIGEARLWDVATGRPAGPPLAHRGAVVALAVRPDGKRLLTGSRDGTAQLWHAESGQAVGPPLPFGGAVTAVAFGVEGKVAAAGSQDGTARLLETATGDPVGERMRHQGALTAVAFSPDGKTFVTAGADKSVRRWDPATGKSLGELGEPMPHPHEVRALAFSPDGKTLVTGCGENNSQTSGGFTWAELRTWDVTSGRPKRLPVLCDSFTRGLTVSPDGRRLVTFGNGGPARVWNLDADPPTNVRLEPGVAAVAFSPDSQLVLTGGSRSTEKGWRAVARLWDAATGQPRGEYLFHFDAPEAAPGQASQVYAVGFRPDGQTFFTVSGTTARLWETASGKPVGEPLRHPAPDAGAQFSPDGRMILTRSTDRSARFWDVATGKPVGPPMFHAHPVLAMAFSPDGRMVATAGGTTYGSLEGVPTGFVQLWDVKTARPIGGPLRHSHGVTAVAFSPDGRSVLSASRDGTARLWHAPGRVEGGVPEVIRWAQALSGFELDADGAFIPLDDATRTQRAAMTNDQ